MKKIVITDGIQYVGIKKLEKGCEISLVNTVEEALNYKTFLYYVARKSILKKVQKRIGKELRYKKFNIIERGDLSGLN